MSIYVNICQYMSICVNRCQYMSISIYVNINICQYMSIYVNIIISIYVNIHQYTSYSHGQSSWYIHSNVQDFGGISMVETTFRYTTILSRWQVLDLKAPSPANLPLTTGDWTRSAQDSWYLLMMAYSWTNGSLLRCAKNTTVQQGLSQTSAIFGMIPPIHHRIRKIHQGTWHRAAAKQLHRTHLLSAWPRLGTLW